tara:strand:+ start:1187 stop:1615 length:429 start_codon:yes stop_codon:yes gene_type:complete
MSKHGTWTVVFLDKKIIKRTGEFDINTAKGLVIEDDSFWGQSKFNGLHAIQFTDDGVDNDQVEFADKSNRNTFYDASVYGDFSQFTDKWDAAYLIELQNIWDADVLTVANEKFGQTGELAVKEETIEEQTTRKGPRPTSYHS